MRPRWGKPSPCGLVVANPHNATIHRSPLEGGRQAKGASPQAHWWGAKAKAPNVCDARRPANKPPNRCTFAVTLTASTFKKSF